LALLKNEQLVDSAAHFLAKLTGTNSASAEQLVDFATRRQQVGFAKKLDVNKFELKC
jgi:hypothetical protein